MNVDHLDPQAFGGDDDPVNLRIAHGTCNSFRGVDDPEDARLVLADTTDEPMSEAAYDLLSVGGSIAVGVIAGRAFAKTRAQGEEDFNGGAALLFGLGTFLLTRAYY